ncbi:peptide chain release factor N(5)-glutamine methyltransferase [Sphingomonas bacterium]|uniref:peptide chain release factor N(5)-glutamine methyltransferase n=1 Tax=Sphingomonas bacterium TaxID=1895847 RepID=UPI001576C593|nr:peptide chain release factor N(5)-glutamine methyltransferase [Sphingomonas bacterium]
MVIADALRGATARLASVSDTPRLDAEMLMAHALGVSREAMLLSAPPDAVPAGFEPLLRRRLAHEPIAYIVGRKGFWTIDLAVTPAVLIPRPESETLIEAAIDHFGSRAPGRILDLGTGSGALLLAALAQWPEAAGEGVDLSRAALVVAAANAWRLEMEGRARFLRCGWKGDPRADLILCNPPYIGADEHLPPSVARHEPASALYAGADGLDAYRLIAPLLDFAPGGVACIEIGATQAAAVSALFAEQGFAVALRRDLGGRDRCLAITR